MEQTIIHKVFLYDIFNNSCLLAFIEVMIKMDFVNQSSKAKNEKKNKCIYYWIVISIEMKIHIHASISLVLYLCT